jgi:hypothetical protein
MQCKGPVQSRVVAVIVVSEGFINCLPHVPNLFEMEHDVRRSAAWIFLTRFIGVHVIVA